MKSADKKGEGVTALPESLLTVKMENLVFDHYTFLASDLWTAKRVEPASGMPAFADHVFSTRRMPGQSEFRRGAGLYVIQCRDVPIYVGKYLGTSKSAFGGDILAARWHRHMSTISLRGAKLSISRRLRKAFLGANEAHALASDLGSADSVKLCKDRGYQVAANRLAFAAQTWGVLSGPPSSWLGDYRYSYVQLRADAWQQVTSTHLWDAIDAAELLAIASLGPQVDAGSHIVRRSPVATTDVLAVFDRILHDALSQPLIGPEPDPVAVATREIGRGLRQQDEDVAGERFWEALPGDAAEIVRLVLEGIEADEALEVHFTRTEGGDLRIRVVDLARPRNAFTCTYKPRVERLFCRAMVSTSELEERRGIEAALLSQTSEPLWVEFNVNTTIPGIAATLAVIVSRSIENMRQATPDSRD